MSQFTYEGVGPTTPVGVAAVHLLSARMQPMFELEEAASSGADMDAVHDMRVASRRTREALRIFCGLYRREDMKRTTRAVRTVTRALGTVRDADVFCERFSAMSHDTDNDAERFALAYVIGYRRAHRVRDLEDMRAAFHKLDLANERGRILRSLHSFRSGVDIGDPLVWLAEDTLKERVEEFFGHLPAALEETAFLEQHEMRKAGKHLRYAIETFRACLDPDKYDGLHKGVKKFQDVIGELHDRVVFIDSVRGVAMTCDTSSAGVTTEGVEAIISELERERSDYYQQFLALVEATPEAEYTMWLLGALLPGPIRPARPAPKPLKAPAEPSPFTEESLAVPRPLPSPLARLAALFRRPASTPAAAPAPEKPAPPAEPPA